MYFQNCNSKNFPEKNFLKFATSPEKLQKTDLKMRNITIRKFSAKIEKRSKSKVRAMKFCN